MTKEIFLVMVVILGLCEERHALYLPGVGLGLGGNAGGGVGAGIGLTGHATGGANAYLEPTPLGGWRLGGSLGGSLGAGIGAHVGAGGHAGGHLGLGYAYPWYRAPAYRRFSILKQ